MRDNEQVIKEVVVSTIHRDKSKRVLNARTRYRPIYLQGEKK